MPVIMPVAEPTPTTAGLLLVHVPPVALLLNVLVWPAHTLAVPVMADGAADTVTVLVAVQPDESA